MKNFLRHVYSLGVKEIIAIFRDPMLCCLIIYSFSLGVCGGAKSIPEGIKNASIAIVDEDNSALTKRLTDAFMPPLFNPPEKISHADMDRLLDEGKYTFILVFPANFQEKVLANHTPQIQINVDATRMSQAFAGNNYIQEILMREINAFLRQNVPDATIYSAQSLVRNRFNQNLDKSWEGAVSELINNIAMIALILTGAALIRERERGTLEHLLVTPVTPLEMMLAKVWSMILVVMVTTLLSLFFVIYHFLDIPIAGSVTLFMVGVCINLFAITSMGIFLACFTRDMPQLGILMILVLMPMQILSGGTTSQENMPLVIQWLMQLAPTTHFVVFSKAILFRGAEFSLIWGTFVKMFLQGVFFFVIALMRFRRTVAG